MSRQKLFVILLFVTGSVAPLFAQSGKQFTIPMEDLKAWAGKPTTTIQVSISGHSAVHPVESDCEMHFGGKVATYKGDPDGWVLEPMNACDEPVPGNSTYSKTAWTSLGNQVTNTTITAEGVVRIWPEHLTSSGPSNPAHVVELHPLLKLTAGTKSYNFSNLVYAPDGFAGGLKTETATAILTDTAVTATESSGTVNVNFDSGRIGNFTVLTVNVLCDSIEDADGNHRMDGEVLLSRSHTVPVRLVTVAGSAINDTVAQLKAKGQKTAAYDFLVLFSLDPVALYNAASISHGQPKAVDRPLQLIVYGEAEAE